MDMDLEQKAIMRLREAADTSERFYKAPLIVTTSGGKDSSVCVALAEKAGIDFEVMHNHTTVDAPETVYFIRHEFKRLEEKGVKCTVNYPHYKGERVTMWSLIAFDKMLEERKRRGKMQGTWRAGTTGRDIFHWWMEDGVLPGQMEFDDLLLEEDEEW